MNAACSLSITLLTALPAILSTAAERQESFDGEPA